MQAGVSACALALVAGGWSVASLAVGGLWAVIGYRLRHRRMIG